jgi:hypothetical protein
MANNENIEYLDIKELDPDSIRPSKYDVRNPNYDRGGSKIVVIGKPGVGKTRLIHSLIYEKRFCFPTCMIQSGTEDSNESYGKIIPSTFIYNELDMDAIKNFVKRQKIAKKYISNPWSLLILDDCTDDPKIFNTPLFNGIYKNGRHWVLFFILSLQYSLDIKPVIRNNIDGVFLLRESNLRNRRSIYENYAGLVPSFKLFCTIMDQLTENYHALYINNQSISNNWWENIFWYKAKTVPENFKLGCCDYWEFHNQRFNENYQPSFI